MTSNEINLLPEEAFIEREKAKKIKGSVLRVTISMALVTSIFILGAFVYSFYLKNQASDLRKRVELERQKIEKMREKEILLSWTKTKVLAAQKALSTKPTYNLQLTTMDLVSNLATADAVLSAYDFEGPNIKFTVTVPNSTIVENFIGNFLTANTDKESILGNIVLKYVERQEDGSYKLSFEGILAK